MNKLLTFSLAITLSLPAMANQLSPEDAIARLKAEGTSRGLRISMAGRATPLLSVKAKADSDFTGVYLFDNGADGFIVIAADDCATPLLGYSDTGISDPENIPPQLQYWLDFYANEIYLASRADKAGKRDLKKASVPNHKPIAPMIKTKWNQNEPYNLLCPMDGDWRSVTGCVATAMAQVMNYYQWPPKGTGTNTYVWRDQTMTTDFSNVTFDWTNMLDIYDSEATEQQNMAVATLMSNCGLAVDMDYSANFSGANAYNVAMALYNNFGYDRSMATAVRYFYTADEWDAMVYNELASGRPVIYCGDSKTSGHEFICDGYSENGFYHFNWGWGGVSDGYFLLSALDPNDQGIGGSPDDSGYDFYQLIVLNTKPAETDSQVTPMLCAFGSMELFRGFDEYLENGSQIYPGDPIVAYCFSGINNLSCAEVTVMPVIKLVSDSGKVIYLEDIEGYVSVRSTYGLGGVLSYLPDNLTDGKYSLSYACFTEDGRCEEIRKPLTIDKTYELDVKDGVATVYTVTNSDLKIDTFKFTSPVYFDRLFTSEIMFSNPGTKGVYAEYVIDLYDDNWGYVASSTAATIELEPGQSEKVTFSAQFPSTSYVWNPEEETYESKKLEAGDYHYAVSTDFTYRTLYISDETIHIDNCPETTVEATIKLAGDDNVFTSEIPTFNINVECTQGYFTNKVYLYVYPDIEEGTYPLGYGLTPFMIIPEGKSQSVELPVSFDTSDYDYFFAVAFMLNDDYLWQQLSEKYFFTKDSSGVGEITSEKGITILSVGGDIQVTASAPLESIEIFSIGGTQMTRVEAGGETSCTLRNAGLRQGVYILSAKDIDGRVIIRKFTK